MSEWSVCDGGMECEKIGEMMNAKEYLEMENMVAVPLDTGNLRRGELFVVTYDAVYGDPLSGNIFNIAVAA